MTDKQEKTMELTEFQKKVKACDEEDRQRLESVNAKMVFIGYSKLREILTKELGISKELKFLSGVKDVDTGLMFTFTDKNVEEATIVCEVPGHLG